jgi:hypothetical protein
MADMVAIFDDAEAYAYNRNRTADQFAAEVRAFGEEFYWAMDLEAASKVLLAVMAWSVESGIDLDQLFNSVHNKLEYYFLNDAKAKGPVI